MIIQELVSLSFTGSREVGTTHCMKSAAKVNEGQIWLKRVIAEMGGKDTIVVDKEADLELSCTINREICIWFQRSKMFSLFTCCYS